MIKQMACYDAYQVGSAIEKWRIGNRADEVRDINYRVRCPYLILVNDNLLGNLS